MMETYLETTGMWSYQAMQQLPVQKVERIYNLVKTGFIFCFCYPRSSNLKVNELPWGCWTGTGSKPVGGFSWDLPRPTNATELVDIEQQLEQFRGSTLKVIMKRRFVVGDGSEQTLVGGNIRMEIEFLFLRNLLFCLYRWWKLGDKLVFELTCYFCFLRNK